MPLPASELLPADDETLEAPITELAAHIHAATYRLLTLIAELDRREIWADHGCRSCAHWLNWKCGIDIGAGREKVRTAKALQSLPKIMAAHAGGTAPYLAGRMDRAGVMTPGTQNAIKEPSSSYLKRI